MEGPMVVETKRLLRYVPLLEAGFALTTASTSERKRRSGIARKPFSMPGLWRSDVPDGNLRDRRLRHRFW